MCKCIKECVKWVLERVASLPLYMYIIAIFLIMAAFTWGIDHNWHSIASWFGNNNTNDALNIYNDLANFLYVITGFFTAILAAIAYINFKLFNKTSSQSNLLQIDERWGSPEIIKARQIIHVLYRTVCDEVKFEEQNPRITLEKDVYPKVARTIVQMSISKHKEIRDAFI